jgi:hypothetical protein
MKFPEKSMNLFPIGYKPSTLLKDRAFYSRSGMVYTR